MDLILEKFSKIFRILLKVGNNKPMLDDHQVADLERMLARADSQNRAEKLVMTLEHCSDEQANQFLREWFNVCDAIGEYAKDLAKHFDRAGFVTDTEEKLVLPCTVYRAGWEDSDPSTGLSWTTDLAFAKRFAEGLFGPRAWFLGIRRSDVDALIWSATCT